MSHKDDKDQGKEPLKVEWRIDRWYPDIPENQRNLLRIYHHELIKFNKVINLIGVKTIPVADAIHFADSILAGRSIFTNYKPTEVYDFGTGNGIPGLVFAILFPEIKFKLVDVDQRKSEFLKHVISVLHLTNVSVINSNIEELPEGSVMCAVNRGFASLSKTLLIARPLVPKGGVIFHLKGEEWSNEVTIIPSQLCSFWRPALYSEYKLPIGEIKFAVIRTDKLA